MAALMLVGMSMAVLTLVSLYALIVMICRFIVRRDLASIARS